MYSEMDRLARQCVKELRSVLRPIHRVELAGWALNEMSPGYKAKGNPAEDLREKIALHRRHGLFYIPDRINGYKVPDSTACKIGLTEWFINRNFSGDPQPGDQVPLINDEEILFTPYGDAEWWVKNITDTLIASEMMPIRSVNPRIDRLYGSRAMGFGVIQPATSRFAKDKWPTFVDILPSVGINKDDLILKLEGNEKVGVDVMSAGTAGFSDRRGLVNVPIGGKKLITNVHIVPEIRRSKIALLGYRFGDELPGEKFSSYSLRPVSQILVRMNCAADKIDYELVREVALFGRPTGTVDKIMPRGWVPRELRH